MGLDKISREKEQIIKTMAGKKMWSYNACQDRIDELHQQQQTQRLTANEERAILKEKKELENSLPLIAQVEEKDEEMKKVKERKKVLGRKIHDKIEEKNKLSAKIDEVKKQQADQKGEDAEKQEKPKKRR